MNGRLKFALRALISLALIALVVRKVNWRDLGGVLSRVDPGWAVAGWALSSLVLAGLAVRWHMLLRQQGLNFPFPTIFALTWAGQFFNSILPGSTGGDLVKIYQLCRLAPTRKAAAVATILTDRLSTLFALLVLATLGFILEPAPLRLIVGDRVSARNAVWLALAAAAVGILSVWLLLRFARGAAWLGRIQRVLAGVTTHLVSRRRLMLVAALAFGIHVTNFSVIYFFARALNIAITYREVLLMMPVILFVVLIPVTINGHGLRELLLIGYFSYMGITVAGHPEIRVEDTAVALSLLAVANDLLWTLPGGVWYALRFQGRVTPEAESGGNAAGVVG